MHQQAILRNRFILLLGILLSEIILCTSVMAAELQPQLIKGQSFLVARKAILAAGWKPQISHQKLSDKTPINNYGDSALFYKAGIREVESCSGTGQNYCMFNYKLGKACLRVGTLGEYGVGSGAFINDWSSICPEK